MVFESIMVLYLANVRIAHLLFRFSRISPLGLHQFLFEIPVRVICWCPTRVVMIVALVIICSVVAIVVIVAAIIFMVVVVIVVVCAATIRLNTQIQTVIQQHFIFILFFEMLTDFRVTMLVVSDNDFAGIGGGDARFTIVFTR